MNVMAYKKLTDEQRIIVDLLVDIQKEVKIMSDLLALVARDGAAD